jgi:hypothetical protein
MTTDAIVQEVRDARASIAAEFGYDLSKYLVWIRKQTRLRKEAIGETRPGKAARTTDGASVPPATGKRRVRASKAAR